MYFLFVDLELLGLRRRAGFEEGMCRDKVGSGAGGWRIGTLDRGKGAEAGKGRVLTRMLW